MSIALVAGLLLVLGLVLYYLRFRGPKPDFPPLAVGNDHPLIAAAIERARASIAEFVELARQHPEQAVIKFAAETSSHNIEHVSGGGSQRDRELRQRSRRDAAGDA